jgi:hypothetical protein
VQPCAADNIKQILQVPLPRRNPHRSPGSVTNRDARYPLATASSPPSSPNAALCTPPAPSPAPIRNTSPRDSSSAASCCKVARGATRRRPLSTSKLASSACTEPSRVAPSNGKDSISPPPPPPPPPPPLLVSDTRRFPRRGRGRPASEADSALWHASLPTAPPALSRPLSTTSSSALRPWPPCPDQGLSRSPPPLSPPSLHSSSAAVSPPSPRWVGACRGRGEEEKEEVERNKESRRGKGGT